MNPGFRISDLSVERNDDNPTCEDNIFESRIVKRTRKEIFHYYLAV